MLLKLESSISLGQNLWVSLMRGFKLYLGSALEIWEESSICFKYYGFYLVSINDEQGWHYRGTDCLWFHRKPKPQIPELNTWCLAQRNCLIRISKNKQFSQVNGDSIGNNLEKYLSASNREENAERTTCLLIDPAWGYWI